MNTPIYLSDEEARQFVLFQKHRKLFELLDKAEVFGRENSSFQVHYNHKGEVMCVDLRYTVRVI